MTTQYPGGLDAFFNPTPANSLSDPLVLHSDEHSNANDAISALEHWVGVSGSLVPATIEYRLNHLPGGGGGGGAGIMGWSAGIPLGTGTVLNVRGAVFTLSGTVLDLFVTGSMPSGPAGGDLTGTYPNPQVMWGNGTGFYGTVFAPLTHAYQHESGGFDPIPIDMLAGPVYPQNWLDANTGTHGLMRPLSGDPTNYIGGDGLEHTMPAEREQLYLEDFPVFVTGTHSLITNYPSGTQATASQLITSTTTGTVFAQPFMSAAGIFGFVPSQEVRIVITSAITAGTKVTFLYSQLLKYSSSGTEALIGSSNLHQITASPFEFDLGMNIPDTIFDPTERLELKFFGIAQGAGSNPTATVYYDGNTSSRVEIGVDFIGGGMNVYNTFLGLMGQNQGFNLGTGTILNVNGSRLNMTLSGTVFNLTNSPDPVELIGVFGVNQGVNLGTGTTLSVTGSRLSMSLVGTTLNLTSSPEPQDNIGVMGWQNGVPVGTGTVLNFRGSPPITLSLSGTVLDVFVTGQALPQPVFGIAGQQQGVPLGSGTTLNVNGSRLTMTLSGAVFNLTNSPDPVELIGVYGFNQGVPLGTGTSINFRGPNVVTTISGTVLDVFITGSGGGGGGGGGVDQIGFYGQQTGTNLGTGTVLNVNGSRLTLSLSGTVFNLTNTPDLYNIQWFFGDGVNLIQTGSITAGYPYVEVPADSTVQSWSVVADVTGSITVDILRSSYANFPPSSPLLGLGQPLLSGKRTNNANASGTAFVLGTDYLLASVESASTGLHNVTLSLRMKKIS